jgi:hypothetical protein
LVRSMVGFFRHRRTGPGHRSNAIRCGYKIDGESRGRNRSSRTRGGCRLLTGVFTMGSGTVAR